MAALYGRMTGNRGEATRIGTPQSGIESHLETWDGEIKTVLQADGSFEVFIGSKRHADTLIATGNVNDDQREVKVNTLEAVESL